MKQLKSQVLVEQIIKRYNKLVDHPYVADSWNYEIGFMLLAFAKVYRTTGEQKYLAYVIEHTNRYVDELGQIGGKYNQEHYNLDQINFGKVLLFLFKETQDMRYKRAAERLIEQLSKQPMTEGGNYWHKNIYPNQVWLDGLYMYGPFIMEWALMQGDIALVDRTAAQLLRTVQLTEDAHSGLLYHACDESRLQRWSHLETGHSPHIWGRAMGWFCMALIDSIELLQAGGHTEQVDKLSAALQRIMNSVVRVQDSASGAWYQILDEADREGNYLEASCTCMFTYVLQKGVNLNVLERKYADHAKSAFQYIEQSFVEQDEENYMHLTGINRVAGLGGEPYRDGSYAYYINEPIVSDDPKGVAPFIIATLEMDKFKES